MGYIIVYGYLIFWSILLLLLKNKLNLKVEYTRKVMHFVTGFTWVIINHYYNGTIHMIIIPISFIIINYLSWKYHLFSIVERQNNNHLGSIYYAVAFAISQTIAYFWPSYLMPSGVAMTILTFGDGFSSIIGVLIKKHNPFLIYHKTIFGFLANCFFSLIGLVIFQFVFQTTYSISDLLIIILTGAVLEIIIDKGLDNFTIVFGVMAIAYFLA